jgi:hypothetical protein
LLSGAPWARSSRLLKADKPEIDPAVETALIAVRAAQAVVEALQSKVTAQTASMSAAEATMGVLALEATIGSPGAGKRYEAAVDAVAGLQKEGIKLASALEAAKGNAAKAETALHQVSIAGTLKTQKRLAGQREKAAGELATALQAATAAWKKLGEVSDLVVSSWPGGITMLPGNAGLLDKERVELVGLELLRLSGYVPLQRNAKATFPGTQIDRIMVNPSTLPTLVKTIEVANSYLLRRLQGDNS